ncbi:MAG: DUF916 domain-containing protein [Microbacteriaceae bacterium]|nr:DUF916 domain-containing protein [Microbacteriaceae bacterium]
MTRRRMPRTAPIVLAALGAVLLCSPTAWAQDAGAAPNADDLVWTVRPSDNAVGTGRPNFGYRADPGAAVSDSLDVTNRGDTTLTLGVYAADAFTTESGSIDLLTRDEESIDVATWIELGVDSITVEPQQTVTVPFTLAVPADASPGDHVGGIVTTSTLGSGAFAVERRFGSRVQVRVSGELAPELELSDVAVGYGTELNPFSASTATLTYAVANTGNVRLDAHPTIVVHGPLGMLARTAAVEDLGELLPGSSRRFRVEVPGVWAFFAVTATVELEPFPTNHNDSAAQFDLPPVSGSATTFALNWGQVVLLLVVVLLLIAGRRWQQRRRRTVQAAIDEAVEQALAARDADL